MVTNLLTQPVETRCNGTFLYSTDACTIVEAVGVCTFINDEPPFQPSLERKLGDSKDTFVGCSNNLPSERTLCPDSQQSQ